MAALWLGGTMQGNVLNWLGVVVDSAICGCKNGSSLTVGEKMAALRLGGTMQGNVLNWLRFCKRTRARCSCRVMERLTDALAAGCTWQWLFRCCVGCIGD